MMAASKDSTLVSRASTTDASIKSSSKVKKDKKEKSSKKRKGDILVEAETPVLNTVQEVVTPEEDEEVPVPKPSSKGKKEKKKSDKFGKLEALIDSELRHKTPQTSEAMIETTEGNDVKSAPNAKKDKKDKSSKKRKAEELAESVPTTMEDTTLGTNGAEKSLKKRKTLAEEIEVDITAPEPPSKKALRALKKGKPLPPSKSGADSPEPQPKKVEEEKRSGHGIWIGNLPFHVSKEDLRAFFVDHSDITEELITRIHMKGPNDHKSANKVEEKKKFKKVEHNTGFAYVDFSSEEEVKKAIELSEQLLGGRRVLIKDAKSYEGRPLKTKEEIRKDGKPPSTRVFLGNLSFDTTEDSLKEHFEKCGKVESVKVATFEDTGKCKGYAWIVFEELKSAENAVRGYVFLEEEEEASDQSASEDESESSDEESVKVKVSKPKNIKRRKWWVNKIKGRPLRMEFAEDAQVRYKKRYGANGTKGKVEGAEPAGEGTERAEKPMVIKKVEYRQPYAPRLTGGIVESKGSKTTF